MTGRQKALIELLKAHIWDTMDIDVRELARDFGVRLPLRALKKKSKKRVKA